MKPYVTKNYLRLFIQNAKQRVLEVFFQYTEKEFSLSDLAKEAAVAKPHIGKILKEFEKNELISITKLSKIWRIRANQQQWNFLKSKIIYNLNFMYNSGLVEFLNNYYNSPKAIILFGSFRRGEDFSDSDIDIAIEIEGIEEYKTIFLRELIEHEKAIGRKIQIHLFNKQNIDNHLFNNIANGIVLLGFLEVNK